MPVVSSHPVGGPLIVAILASQTKVPKSDIAIQSVCFPRQTQEIYLPNKGGPGGIISFLLFSITSLHVSHRYPAVQLPL